MRKNVIMMAIVLVGASALQPARAEEPAFVGTVEVGQPVYWDGPFVEQTSIDGRTMHRALCTGPAVTMRGCDVSTFPPTTFPRGAMQAIAPRETCSINDCHEFTLGVGVGGRTLRIALDQPSIQNSWAVDVFDPEGNHVVSAPWDNGRSPYMYSSEWRVADPEPGEWSILVTPYDVVRSSYRMRAVLDGEAQAPSGTLAPNLRIVPPFEFASVGCQASETVRYGESNCLRFSTGPANVGDGPLDMRIRDAAPDGTFWQRVHDGDGTYTEFEAGTYEFHAEHGHYHASAPFLLRLFRVIDEQSGQMEQASEGPKGQFCTGDYAIADWSSSAQDMMGSGESEAACEPSAGDVHIGLTRGWADIYAYFIEGTFVPHPGDEGHFVLRVEMPPNDLIETDVTDNAGYTEFEIDSDGTITVLERGLGFDPWDPAKVLVNDGRALVAFP